MSRRCSVTYSLNRTATLNLTARAKSGSNKDMLPLSVEGQVNVLINEATSFENLANMYMGWAPYM